MIIDIDKYPIDSISVTIGREHIDSPVSRTTISKGLEKLEIHKFVEFEYQGRTYEGNARISIDQIREIRSKEKLK